MVKTKGIEATMKNWEASHAVVAGRYKDGVMRANDTIDKAIAAKDLFVAKTQQALSEGRREKGLAKVTNQQWQQAAANKGSARIVSGMKESIGKMRAGMGDVLATIESTQIAERTADPEANVDGRVKPIVRNLAAMKRR